MNGIINVSFDYSTGVRTAVTTKLNEKECGQEYFKYDLPVIDDDLVYYIKYRKPSLALLNDFWASYPQLPINIFTFVEGKATIYFFQLKSYSKA
mgnify:CR=1 FL=1|jgi:hypothetical protein